MAPTALIVLMFAAFGRNAAALIGAHAGGFMQGAIAEWAPVSLAGLVASADGWIVSALLLLAVVGAVLCFRPGAVSSGAVANGELPGSSEARESAAAASARPHSELRAGARDDGRPDDVDDASVPGDVRRTDASGVAGDGGRVGADGCEERGSSARAYERVEAVFVLIGVVAALSMSYRGLSLFVIAGMPLWLPSAVRPLSRLASRLSPRALSAAALAVMVAVVAWRAGGRPILRPGFGLDETRFPVAAVRAMRATGATTRVYNAFNFGGYLIYEGVPVFVDGRAITLYPEGFLLRFAAAYGSAAMFEQLAERYEVDTVLMPADSARARSLVVRLSGDPGWREVFRDEVAVVFVRASSSPSR